MQFGEINNLLEFENFLLHRNSQGGHEDILLGLNPPPYGVQA